VGQLIDLSCEQRLACGITTMNAVDEPPRNVKSGLRPVAATGIASASGGSGRNSVRASPSPPLAPGHGKSSG
jgi:hypothetical protein